MPQSMPDAPVGASPVNANVDVIAGLREVAAFLEAHPELPAFHGFVHCGVYGRETAREQLTHFAGLLGERATEVADDYANVRIAAELPGVAFEMRTTVRVLGGQEPKPRREYDYEPIIARDGGEHA